MQVFFNQHCPNSAILLASISTHPLTALLANLICSLPLASEWFAFPCLCWCGSGHPKDLVTWGIPPEELMLIWPSRTCMIYLFYLNKQCSRFKQYPKHRSPWAPWCRFGLWNKYSPRYCLSLVHRRHRENRSHLFWKGRQFAKWRQDTLWSWWGTFHSVVQTYP